MGFNSGFKGLIGQKGAMPERHWKTRLTVDASQVHCCTVLIHLCFTNTINQTASLQCSLSHNYLFSLSLSPPQRNATVVSYRQRMTFRSVGSGRWRRTLTVGDVGTLGNGCLLQYKGNCCLCDQKWNTCHNTASRACMGRSTASVGVEFCNAM